MLDVLFIHTHEPAHNKTYNTTCAQTVNTWTQAEHPSSLISLSYRMCLLQPPGYPKRDKQELL